MTKQQEHLKRNNDQKYFEIQEKVKDLLYVWDEINQLFYLDNEEYQTPNGDVNKKKVAEKLNISRPTLNKHLKDLDEEYEKSILKNEEKFYHKTIKKLYDLKNMYVEDDDEYEYFEEHNEMAKHSNLSMGYDGIVYYKIEDKYRSREYLKDRNKEEYRRFKIIMLEQKVNNIPTFKKFIEQKDTNWIILINNFLDQYEEKYGKINDEDFGKREKLTEEEIEYERLKRIKIEQDKLNKIALDKNIKTYETFTKLIETLMPNEKHITYKSFQNNKTTYMKILKNLIKIRMENGE